MVHVEIHGMTFFFSQKGCLKCEATTLAQNACAMLTYSEVTENLREIWSTFLNYKV